MFQIQNARSTAISLAILMNMGSNISPMGSKISPNLNEIISELFVNSKLPSRYLLKLSPNLNKIIFQLLFKLKIKTKFELNDLQFQIIVSKMDPKLKYLQIIANLELNSV